MNEVLEISCKDCGAAFRYAAESAAYDRLHGRSAPERCPRCRELHRREYQSLGVSHTPVLQIRTDGFGGLATYNRERPPPRQVVTERLPLPPFPIDEAVGSPDKTGTLLHGLLDDKRRVHLVVGPTGSGKSTWLPFRLLTCPELLSQGPIAITQPRIPAAERPATFVGQLYYGDTLEDPVGPGLVVGFRHSNVGRTKTDHANRAVFMTDGTLLNELRNGQARRYSVIMIDEAHERSINIDTILTLLKMKLHQWPRLQVIIASATVDAEGFKQFFGGEQAVAEYVSGGFTYPILELFSNETRVHCPQNVFDSACGRHWATVSPQAREQHWLGPECWSHGGIPEHRLRYYPQFEALVLEGIVTDDERQVLQQGAGGPWTEIVDTLCSLSRRTRSLAGVQAEGMDIGQSLRGQATPQQKGLRSNSVGRRVRERVVAAAVQTILELVEHDRQEAPRRHARWRRRLDLGWPNLFEPFAVGHILAFLATVADVDACARAVRSELGKRGWSRENIVVRYYRDTPRSERQHVEADTPRSNPKRKIVIGSNLAETSLTLDGLVYVVDSGLICQEELDEFGASKSLPTIYHSQAGCRQRVGRVGRKEPGEARRLYTREELRRHRPYTVPQVARQNAEALVLSLVHAGVPANASILHGALMSPPPLPEIERALASLKRFSAIDEDGDVTLHGDELARTEHESFREAQMLAEADRFGVLWEMAIFLAMARLSQSAAPPLEPEVGNAARQWSSLWEPNDCIIHSESEEAPRGSDQELAWADPYRLGNAMEKQRAIVEGCLDDLEVYLKIWQGWSSWADVKERQAWAEGHGVNHTAMLQVETKLGIGPKLEKGHLNAFWDLRGKGQMRRDVNFNRLDLVRFLYLAGRPEWLCQRRGDTNEFAQHPQVGRDRRRLVVHQESAWSAGLTTLTHMGRQVQRGTCVAEARSIGGDTMAMRHVIWVDSSWLEHGIPSFAESPLALARRFAPITERCRAFLGELPLATGPTLARLRSRMPALPPPSRLEVMQWTSVLANKEHDAYVALDVHHPTLCSRRLLFAQLLSGPLLPVAGEEVAGTLSVGSRVAVHVEQRPDAFLYAVPSSRRPPPSGMQDGPPAAHQAIQPPANVVPLPQPAEPTPLPPGRDLYWAQVKRVEVGSGRHSILAQIERAPYAGNEVHVEYAVSESLLRAEAKAGRRLEVEVWERRGSRRFGGLKRWLDGGPLKGVRDDWPVGTHLEATVEGRAEGPMSDRFVVVTVPRPGSPNASPYKWWARHDGSIAAGARVTVKIVRWVDSGPRDRPHLEIVGSQ